MNKKIKLIIYTICILFSYNLLKATPNSLEFTEEVLTLKTSSVFLVLQDSVFQKEYDKIFDIYKKEDYINALKLALSLYESEKGNTNKQNSISVAILLADIYDKTNNHNRALQYYRESLNLLERGNFQEFKKNNYLSENLAKIYLRLGSSFQNNAQKDSAKYFYKKLENLSSVNNAVNNYKSMAYSNLIGIYEIDSLYDTAIEYANKSIDINIKTNNKIGQAKSTNNLGNIYLALNNFEKAKEVYLKGINLIKNDNSQTSVRQKADLYYNLAWAMRNLKDYKAYDFQELSYEIEDGIRDKNYRRMVEKVSMQFDVNRVKREEESKREKDLVTFWLYGSISFLIILSLLYWLNFYKLKQKNLSLKLSQTQLIQNQNIEKIKSESQARILNATIDGKESERKEIAETLHDSVSALLSSANLHLMATKSNFNGKVPVEVDKTQQIIKEASEKIRDLSHTLVSSVLLKFGLNFALNDLASKYSNSQLNIETDIKDLRRYHQNFEIKVYNIIQEFLNNILKHSKAKNAMIKMHEENNKICFEISDDGVGFDKKIISTKDGLGINQIEARILIMKGYLGINSSANNGTKIRVELPILEKETVNHV
ncbi:tetratricopeptide repeat protein [Polaribacter haliotis]|uniref:histidine kinase n=1 Tax=Polaribacter haliotis TaxID=1888915 RepID=A0A7L8AEY5_9FLAO|nr:tetratricopeptide repeat-containing sensor histidine kinase [Polaribacter haliotis]QOD60542.1 tetratricopeptide repeat protein [Polaribacter haliotis]